MRKQGKKGRSNIRAGVVCTLLVIVFTASAFGQNFSYTNVAAPPTGEANHAEILHNIYGGTFTQQASSVSGLLVDYGNTSNIVARRVYDFDDEYVTLDVLTDTLEGKVDQIWTDGTVTVTAEAKYACYNQSFGWNGGGTSTANYYELLTDDDIGNGAAVVGIDGDFLWGSWPTDDDKWWDEEGGYWCPWPEEEKWWTYEIKNNDLKDHFVTYKIEGLGGEETVWLLFMEDVHYCQSDHDFNDFVVELSAIPEPATIALLLLGGLFLRRKS